jgi:carbon-monoxide dehydrogenase medium subunit
MFPAIIENYCRPASVQEALAALAGYDAGEAIFIAGGQSLMQAIKSRMVRPRCLIDLQAIAELKGISTAQGLRIGAMTRYVEIAGATEIPAAFAALRDAAQHVGDRQVRNRGTLGGSCCWNYLASCMPAVTLGLGARFHLLSAAGQTRVVDADDFLLGPLETARADDEILTHVDFAPSAATGSAYRKWGLVTDALPVVGFCMKVTVDGAGRCTAARIALSGLPAGAQRAPAGETALVGSDGQDATLDAALEAIVASVEVQSDKWAEAGYRQQLIRTLGREVAAQAFARARGRA